MKINYFINKKMENIVTLHTEASYLDDFVKGIVSQDFDWLKIILMNTVEHGSLKVYFFKFIFRIKK